MDYAKFSTEARSTQGSSVQTEGLGGATLGLGSHPNAQLQGGDYEDTSLATWGLTSEGMSEWGCQRVPQTPRACLLGRPHS